MATKYVFNGTQSGTADGSFSDPYDLTNLSSAESGAGSGGKVIFKNGAYTMSANLLMASSGVTYEAETSLGAVFTSSVQGTSGKQIQFGLPTTPANDIIVNGLKFVDTGGSTNISGISVQSDQNNKVTLNNCEFINTHANFVGMIGNGQTSNVYLNLTANGCLFDFGASTTMHGNPAQLFAQRSDASKRDINITNCTFVFRGSGQPFRSSNAQINTFKNVILYKDGSSGNIAQSTSYIPANHQGACYYNWSDVTSDDTAQSLIVADPLFVDLSSQDYRLRPGSPCLGAGVL
jgi:hypothetical protein